MNEEITEMDCQIKPEQMSNDEMMQWIEENNLSDWQGTLDYNTIEQIARTPESGQWELRSISLSPFEWMAKPRKGKRLTLPVIMDEDGNVLDGKHRIAEAKYLGETKIEAWVPVPIKE